MFKSVVKRYWLLIPLSFLPFLFIQPIGYDEAEMILNSMSSVSPTPIEWVGNLNAAYNLGPSLINPGWKVRINVSTTNQVRTIYNTIGILRGSIEDGSKSRHLFSCEGRVSLNCILLYF